jgi:hypothetical protein
MSSIQIINPLTQPDWDDLISTHPQATPFHSGGWARVLQDSYGFTPLYFVARNRGRLETLVPFMEVDSPWTGRRGVSLPFTDYCDPLAPDGDRFQEAFEQAQRVGRERGWDYLELRLAGKSEDGRREMEDGRQEGREYPATPDAFSSLFPLPSSISTSGPSAFSSIFHLPSSICLPPPSASYYGHLLDLTVEEEDLKKNSGAAPCATSNTGPPRGWRRKSSPPRRGWRPFAG